MVGATGMVAPPAQEKGLVGGDRPKTRQDGLSASRPALDNALVGRDYYDVHAVADDADHARFIAQAAGLLVEDLALAEGHFCAIRVEAVVEAAGHVEFRSQFSRDPAACVPKSPSP